MSDEKRDPASTPRVWQLHDFEVGKLVGRLQVEWDRAVHRNGEVVCGTLNTPYLNVFLAEIRRVGVEPSGVDLWVLQEEGVVIPGALRDEVEVPS